MKSISGKKIGQSFICGRWPHKRKQDASEERQMNEAGVAGSWFDVLIRTADKKRREKNTDT